MLREGGGGGGGFRSILWEGTHDICFEGTPRKISLPLSGLISYCLRLIRTESMVKVDHEILLTKLRAYGMSETTAKWFQSYLRDREQFVSIGNQDSTYVKVPHGVPQGSILNPFFCVLQ